MKKNKFWILLGAALICTLGMTSQTAYAQKGEVGLRFMPTFTSFSLKTSTGGTVNSGLTLGYGYGLLIGYNFTEHVGVQAEVIYNTLTQKYSEADVERQINLQYVNIPLLLSLNTGKTKPVNFNVVIGPQIGLSVGSEIKVTGSDSSIASQAVLSVKKGDLGFAYGAGVDFGLNTAKTLRLGIGFRGVYGLIDISDDNKNYSNESFLVLDRMHLSTYSGYAGFSYLF